VAGDRERAVEAIEAAAKVNAEDTDIQRVRRILRRITEGPPWSRDKTFVKETAHYIVKSDISEKAVAFYAQHLEAIYGMYRKQFGYKAEQKHKARAYVFETREGYMTYAELSTHHRPESTLGYYHPHYRELLIFEGLDREKTLRVLYHEGFHQFLHQLIEKPPYWFNEGVAEFFGATRLVQEGRLRNVKALLDTNYLKRFKDLLRSASRKSFYSGHVGANYAQAWSVIHFFFHYQGGKYAPFIRDYYKVLRDGGTAEEAYETAFKRANLSIMEREWKAYVRALEPPKR
jgi:hypothetical protein